MATIMVQKAARDGMSEAQREALRYFPEVCPFLGTPAEFVDPDGTHWLVYDDHRLTLLDAARGGRIMANAASFPDFDPLGKTRQEIHPEDVRFANENGLVTPNEVEVAEGADPFQAVLDANNAPASIRTGPGTPKGWTPITTEGA